jgi:nucleoside-diphosphate-sugar epimerase
MQILITGISGFVGRNLVEYLKNSTDNTIYGVDIIENQIDGVKKIYAWSGFNEIPEIDVIIHLAGKAHDVDNKANEQEYFEINVELTKKIYDFYLKSNALKFIFISSVKAVADSIDYILTEDETPNPKTPYGKSKLSAENYILEKLPEMPKNVYIFRPCMIYGKGNKGNLNLLYKLVSKGIPWPLGAFDNQRSFFSVNNFTFVFNEFIHSNFPSGIYNLADNETLSTNDLIKIISLIKNKKARIWNIPQPFINFCAQIGSFLRLPFNKERLKKTTENYLVSNKKLIKTLNKQLPVKTKEGLIETLKYF